MLCVCACVCVCVFQRQRDRSLLEKQALCAIIRLGCWSVVFRDLTTLSNAIKKGLVLSAKCAGCITLSLSLSACEFSTGRIKTQLCHSVHNVQ